MIVYIVHFYEECDGRQVSNVAGVYDSKAKAIKAIEELTAEAEAQTGDRLSSDEFYGYLDYEVE